MTADVLNITVSIFLYNQFSLKEKTRNIRTQHFIQDGYQHLHAYHQNDTTIICIKKNPLMIKLLCIYTDQA